MRESEAFFCIVQVQICFSVSDSLRALQKVGVKLPGFGTGQLQLETHFLFGRCFRWLLLVYGSGLKRFSTLDLEIALLSSVLSKKLESCREERVVPSP